MASVEVAKQGSLKSIRPTLLGPAEAITAWWRRQITDAELTETLARHGYSDKLIAAIKHIHMPLPDPSQLGEMVRRDVITEDDWRSTLQEHGWDDLWIDRLWRIRHQLLAPTELLELWRRGEIDEQDFEEGIAKLGFSPEDITRWKALKFYIPPVADVIRFAVREAFYDDYAEEYGLDLEYPEELDEYAEKLGIDERTAHLYWRAHWELPSLLMGFEMFHRRIIDRGTLEDLMVAHDIMPWWREKIVKLSYRPLTRVDVRRMYGLGVLDEQGVYEAYLDLGYSPENARRMTEFTIKYEAGEERELSKGDVLGAYKDGVITRETARTHLFALGYPAFLVETLLARVDHALAKELREKKIESIKARYLAGVIDIIDVDVQLGLLDLPADQIERIKEMFELEKELTVRRPTRSHLERFLRKGIITSTQFVEEMRKLGYSDQYIDWYVRDITAG